MQNILLYEATLKVKSSSTTICNHLFVLFNRKFNLVSWKKTP